MPIIFAMITFLLAEHYLLLWPREKLERQHIQKFVLKCVINDTSVRVKLVHIPWIQEAELGLARNTG